MLNKTIKENKELIEKLLLAEEKSEQLANEIGITPSYLTNGLCKSINEFCDFIASFANEHFNVNINRFRLRSDFHSYMKELEKDLTDEKLIISIKGKLKGKIKEATLKNNKIKFKNVVYSRFGHLNMDFRESTEKILMLLDLYGTPFTYSILEYKEENKNTKENDLVSIYVYVNGNIDLIFKDQESAKAFYNWLQ